MHQHFAGCQAANLATLEEESAELRLLSVGGYPFGLEGLTSLALGETVAAADVRLGQPHHIPDLATATDFPLEAALHGAGFISSLVLPSRAQSASMGILILAWRGQGGYLPRQIPLLRQIADGLAMTMERGRLFAEGQQHVAEMTALTTLAMACKGPHLVLPQSMGLSLQMAAPTYSFVGLGADCDRQRRHETTVSAGGDGDDASRPAVPELFGQHLNRRQIGQRSGVRCDG